MLTAKTRRDLRHAWAIWIEARDYATGAPAPAGFWTGDDAVNIVVDGQTRTYYGAGAALSIEPLTYQLGAVVQVQRASLGPLTPEVRTTLRGYETRQAKAQIHLVMLGDNDQPTTVEEAFVGVLDRLEINEGPLDDAGNSTVTCDVEMVSDARHLTRTLSLKQSDASQRLRNPNDRFRQYADVAGEVKVVWMGDTDNPHRAREKNNIRNGGGIAGAVRAAR